MDWADDVAYSVHDVEDGVHAGLIRPGEIDEASRSALCDIAAEHYTSAAAADLAGALDQLLTLPTLRDVAGYDGSYAAQVSAKQATSELTGRFAGAAVAATRARWGPEPLARYAADLVVPAQVAAECALLKAMAAHYVMRRPGTRKRQAAQRQLLTELVAALRDGAPASLDRDLRPGWMAADTHADRLRVVIDQVAQLTDSSAAARHRRLVRPR
jgi:dGTPase